jgi:hypothetical protein
VRRHDMRTSTYGTERDVSWVDRVRSGERRYSGRVLKAMVAPPGDQTCVVGMGPAEPK